MDNENYKDGWSWAKEDYEDLVEYDPNLFPPDLSDVEAEDFIQGYYDFWKLKDFKL